MASCHALLLKGADAGNADHELAAHVAQLARHAGSAVARAHVHRALDVPEIYAYFELAREEEAGEADVERFVTAARALSSFATGALRVDRLARAFEPPAASSGQSAPFHYVVEMDPADGWRDELFRWYDTEHMPGLASVTGCVRAQRYVNRDGGPFSLACYDLVQRETTASPAWLAVRATPWSDRVRPQFRNPKRTMFLTVR
jgi:hypothetical protein